MDSNPQADQWLHRRRHHSHSHSHRHRPPLQQFREILLWQGWKFVIALVVILLVIYISLVYFTLSRINQDRTQLERLMNNTAAQFTTNLGTAHYATMQKNAEALADDLYFMIKASILARPFAALHPELSARFAELDAAAALGEALTLILEGGEPLVDQLLESGFSSPSRQVSQSNTEATNVSRYIDLLRLSQPTFDTAQSKIGAAYAVLDAVGYEQLSGGSIAEISQLRQLIAQTEMLLQLLQQAPDVMTQILGMQTPQTYLILAANNDEIRPSGGYISAWGWMHVQQGEIAGYAFAPSTLETPDPPPLVMGSALSIPSWWLSFSQPLYAAWDGSWEADFSKTAQMAAWYYDNGDNPHVPVNGVIGIDLVAVQYLLDALGGCTVESRDLLVTSENFREVVYEIRATGLEALPHKQFLGEVYACMIARWQQADHTVQIDILRAVLRALAERHLAVYFRDVEAQSAAVDLGWAGVPSISSDQDYLLFADANIMANKSSSAVQRSFAYDVALHDDGSAESSLAVFYEFPESAALTDAAVNPEHYGSHIDYTTLWQVFTPAGSSFADEASSASGAVEIDTSDSSTRFIGINTVRFGGTSQVRVQYALPDVVTAEGEYQHYRLLLEKQLGSRGDPYHVTVTLPAGCELISSSPNPSSVYALVQQMLEYDLTVDNRLWIEIVYHTKD